MNIDTQIENAIIHSRTAVDMLDQLINTSIDYRLKHAEYYLKKMFSKMMLEDISSIFVKYSDDANENICNIFNDIKCDYMKFKPKFLTRMNGDRIKVEEKMLYEHQVSEQKYDKILNSLQEENRKLSEDLDEMKHMIEVSEENPIPCNELYEHLLSVLKDNKSYKQQQLMECIKLKKEAEYSKTKSVSNQYYELYIEFLNKTICDLKGEISDLSYLITTFIHYYEWNESEVNRSEFDLREQLRGLKDAICSRDRAIRYYKTHFKDKDNNNESYYIPSIIKCEHTKEELKQFPPLQKVNNNNNNEFKQKIINVQSHTPDYSNNKDRIIVPHPPPPLSQQQQQQQQQNSSRLRSSSIQQQQQQPATIDDMNKPVFSVQVGKWQGHNYRWKSLGLYRHKGSVISTTTKLKRPSPRKKDIERNSLVNRISPNQSEVRAMLSTEFSPFIVVGKDPEKYFTEINNSYYNDEEDGELKIRSHSARIFNP